MQFASEPSFSRVGGHVPPQPGASYASAEPKFSRMKQRAAKPGDHTERDLPDYSADWQLPAATASSAEIESRFYYEFARESQTILSLTEKLCHFTRGEMHRAGQRTLSYPAHPLLTPLQCTGFSPL